MVCAVLSAGVANSFNTGSNPLRPFFCWCVWGYCVQRDVWDNGANLKSAGGVLRAD